VNYNRREVGDGNFENTANTVNYVNFNDDRTNLKLDQVLLKNQASLMEKYISKIMRLKDLGLTEGEVVELLEIPLELVKSVNFES
jgi:hypothetical protein